MWSSSSHYDDALYIDAQNTGFPDYVKTWIMVLLSRGPFSNIAPQNFWRNSSSDLNISKGMANFEITSLTKAEIFLFVKIKM
jgi:uncharacterized protein with ATP-grasp and redox domains